MRDNVENLYSGNMGITRLAENIDTCIQQAVKQQQITYAEVIGVLEIKKHDLVMDLNSRADS